MSVAKRQSLKGTRCFRMRRSIRNDGNVNEGMSATELRSKRGAWCPGGRWNSDGIVQVQIQAVLTANVNGLGRKLKQKQSRFSNHRGGYGTRAAGETTASRHELQQRNNIFLTSSRISIGVLGST